MSSQTQRYYSPEEYLAQEEAVEYKNEYRNGEIVPVTGGTTNHNKIAGNFYAHFKFAKRGQNYETYIGDVRLWIPRYRQFTYPDVMVIKGEPVYYGTGTTTVTNPLFIVEVLSNSTRNDEQGNKFLYYRSIPELKEYILIEQDYFYVMQWSKTAESKWLLTKYESGDASVFLESVNFEISLKDIYEGVNF